MLAVCGSCGTRYAPDLALCPQCGSAEREGEMAKIITGVGPSYPEDRESGDPEATGTPDPVTGTPAPPAEPPQPAIAAELAGVREELEHIEAETAPAAPPAPHVPPPPPRRIPPPPAVPGD